MSEFRERTITGVSWSLLGQVGGQALAFLFGAILAHLLSPREFGLIAMITVFTGFASVFTELGLGAALVQKQDVTERHLSSVFWVNAAAGSVLTALLIWAAPWVGQFYGEPILEDLTVIVAVVFFIKSLGIVQKTIFQKTIDFRVLSLIDLAAVLTGGATAVVMAWKGWGVWSLVARSILNALVTTLALWSVSVWHPRWLFDWRAFKELIGFSMSLVGERSLNYWVRNIDDILVGKVIGSDGLGVYSRAYKVMLFPLQNVTRVIERVMFPSLSSIQGEKARVKRIFIQMMRSIAFVTFPLMWGLIVTTDSFVLVVFGPGWSAIVPVLKILALVGLVQSVSSLVGSLFLSQGRADLPLKLGLFTKPLIIVGIVTGLQWGVTGVAAGFGLGVSISQYINLRFAGQLVDLRYGEIVRALRGVFMCSVAMAGIVAGVGYFLPSEWPAVLTLVTKVSVGVIAYWLLVAGFGIVAYKEAIRLLRNR